MASANVAEFTTGNWDEEVVGSDKLVLVDFWAPWCGPCRALAPTIDRIASQFEGKLKVGKVNTDENQDLAIRYGISGIPALLLFKGSDRPVAQMTGAQSESVLVKWINGALGN